MAQLEGRARVSVANPADGGFWYWLGKLYGFAVIVLLALVIVSGLSVYSYFADAAPPAPDLARYARVVPGVTRVVAADGSLLGEFADEWREVVPYEKIPEKLVQAFLAAE